MILLENWQNPLFGAYFYGQLLIKGLFFKNSYFDSMFDKLL